MHRLQHAQINSPYYNHMVSTEPV